LESLEPATRTVTPVDAKTTFVLFMAIALLAWTTGAPGLHLTFGALAACVLVPLTARPFAAGGPGAPAIARCHEWVVRT
jgi:hypothetical protein